HRKRQENLFAKNICDCQLRSCEEGSSCLLLLQFDFFILIEHFFVALAEEKIEWLLHRNSRRLETSGARHFNDSVQSSRDPNLGARTLGRCSPIEVSDLPEIFASQINRSGLELRRKRKLFVRQILEVDEILTHGALLL